jgi:RNA polymerase sigma factor (sigma-70 family)
MNSFNPFDESSDVGSTDAELVRAGVAGSRVALEQLIRRHQGWIFNLAVRMVVDLHDAEDVTQEILIKIIANLGSFQGRSQFRTWLYRIAVNHVLTMRRRQRESPQLTFTQLGQTIDEIPDGDLPDAATVPVDLPLLVEETKMICTMGMLLCLDRRQRLVFTLGEMFGVRDGLGAELLEITPDHFRQLLSRARRDLLNFMSNKCGLVDPANSCRCARKTRALIAAGHVDPGNLRFASERMTQIQSSATSRSQALDTVLEERFAAVFRQQPFLPVPDQVKLLRDVLSSRPFRHALDLEETKGIA